MEQMISLSSSLFNKHAHVIWTFLGQGLNPRCSYDLCHSYGKARSLTHCAESRLKLRHHKDNITGFSLSLSFFFFFCLFRSKPVAYGSPQARGQIRGVAASLCQSHSNAGSELCLQPIPQLRATLDP